MFYKNLIIFITIIKMQTFSIKYKHFIVSVYRAKIKKILQIVFA